METPAAQANSTVLTLSRELDTSSLKMTVPRSRVKYSKLHETAEALVNDEEEERNTITETKKPKRRALPRDDDYYHDDQFEDTVPIKAPVKSILIAVVLFTLGSIMLVLGSLMLAGIMGQGAGSFRAAPLMVVGSIIFIPGAYNVRTAYYAWRGYHGFSYSDIAGFGEDQ